MSNQRHFRQMLEERNAEGRFLCVGLDPVMSRIEPIWENGPKPLTPTMRVRFLTEIVRATAPYAAAFKPNWSFFPNDHTHTDLNDLIQFIQQEAPGVPIILDCKVGDIGASNDGYIEKAFEHYCADAMTVHSYLGVGTWNKALELEGKGLFFLCRTSNPEAADLQDKRILVPHAEIEALTGLSISQAQAKYGWISPRFDLEMRMPVYEYVALKVAALKNPNCSLVVGATAPEQLARVRMLAPDSPILIPGIGRQGGDLAASVQAAGDSFVVNASSSILYAFEQWPGVNYADAARDEAQKLHDQITAARE